MSDVSPMARRVVDRMVAERGPLPDHLVRSVAKRLRRARPGSQAVQKPA